MPTSSTSATRAGAETHEQKLAAGEWQSGVEVAEGAVDMLHGYLPYKPSISTVLVVASWMIAGTRPPIFWKSIGGI